ncbi:TPA: hypothetical protein ACTUXY_003080 [Legionella pneumophila]
MGQRRELPEALTYWPRIKHQVVYRSLIDGSPVEIYIYQFNDEGIGINVQAKESLRLKMTQQLRELKVNLSKQNLIVGFVKLELPFCDVNQFTNFLNGIEKTLPIASIKKEILDTIGVKAIADENAFYTELEELIRAGAIHEARLKTQGNDDEQVHWKFGTLLEKHQRYSEAISVFQEISEENPYYRDALNHSIDILIRYELAHPDMTQEEKTYHLDNKIRFLLRAGNAGNQQLLDNEETLLALANHTASLEKQIEALKNTIEQLTAPASKSPETFFKPAAPNKNSDKENRNDDTMDVTFS